MQRRLSVPIARPDLAQGGITLKSSQELRLMREAGEVVAAVLELLVRSVQPGMRTRELDSIAAREIRRLGARPSFKGYRGYPATICVSLNEEIVHGIPGDRAVREGDIVSLDVGAVVRGYHADAAASVGAGATTPEAERLMAATRQALERGIQQARPGNRVGDISRAVQEYAEGLGFGVVREYVGHGIGRALHEEPAIPNVGEVGKGPLLRPGMVIAIEPMLNLGGWATRTLEDGWTVVTADGSLSAHFEHTVAITLDGPEVLTAVVGGPRHG
ncbi:MAG: type I methionyl aminopeptidase [Chloroflexi bacterium]|nr:type I methionyl aminopeptidase [Chloroflexota bacterium]